MKTKTLSPTQIGALKARFQKCQQALLALDWISEGSVTENHPGTWRWTRKVRAKTVTVALSAEQAQAFERAIANHRRLEKLIKDMRAISQKVLLLSIQGPTRRQPLKHPKARLS